MVRRMSDTPARPMFTVDVVALRYRGRLEVLLIQRRNPPFEGRWALPGGFVDAGEAPEHAAARELQEETGVTGLDLVPVGVFGQPGRDPRGWTVSAAYLAFAPADTRAAAGDDAADARWHPLADLPPLAFDHADILAAARQRLVEIAQVDTRALTLLTAPFRTKQARLLYAEILGEPVRPAPFKAWLRRRQAVERVGPARFRPTEGLTPDWLRR
jgi:8-oxo-dGTP diphosphatase